MIYTFKDENGIEYHADMDDKRFRIKPYQQMLSSCSGALLTSLLSEWLSPIFAINQNQLIDVCCFFFSPVNFSDTIGCGKNTASDPTKADDITQMFFILQWFNGSSLSLSER